MKYQVYLALLLYLIFKSYIKFISVFFYILASIIQFCAELWCFIDCITILF